MQELVASDNLLVGEVCHIEAAAENGPRYTPDSSDDVRRSAANLILLCHAHHRRVDADPEVYTIERLRSMKAEHESAFVRDEFKVNESVIYQVEHEMEAFWEQVRDRQRMHVFPELAIRLDVGATGSDVFQQVRDSLDRARSLCEWLSESDGKLIRDLREFLGSLGYDLASLDAVPYYQNPFENRNWVEHNIGIPNAFIELKALLVQAETLYLAEHVKLHTNDLVAKARLTELKQILTDIAGSWGYRD